MILYNINILIDNMRLLIKKGFNTYYFIKLIKRPEDFFINIYVKKVKFIYFDSSKFYFIYL